MPPPGDDDIDWLYGRERPASEPERTRVMPAGGGWSPPATPPAAQPPAGRGTEVPPGYPAMPRYGADRPGPGSTPPPGPDSGATGKTKRRHPVRNTFRVLGILLVLCVVWLVGVPAYAWSQVSRVDAAPSGARPANQPGKTFLLVGSDSREGLTKAEQKKLGTGSVAGQRTDTVMIVYVPASGDPALISIPRDSYVDIPKNGKNRINAAYAFGGPELLVQTVETNTGLRIDGYLEIGFGGFVNIIDALDGIEMCLPAAIKDRDSHIDLKKGCQNLSGTNALGYVRMRKADPRGDLGRVERQREMLAAVAKKAASPASVLNPFRYWTLCNASAGAVKVGRDTSLAQTLSLALAMRTVANGQGLTLTVPIANTGASTPVGSAVLWDDTRAQAMFAEIAKGDTSKLKKYAK